jgi:hypothetical protein
LRCGTVEGWNQLGSREARKRNRHRSGSRRRGRLCHCDLRQGLPGLDWIEAQPDHDAYLITHERRPHWSSDFDRCRRLGHDVRRVGQEFRCCPVDELLLGASADLHQRDVGADGIQVNIRLEEHKLCLLVLIGVRADGSKELITLADG